MFTCSLGSSNPVQLAHKAQNVYQSSLFNVSFYLLINELIRDG